MILFGPIKKDKNLRIKQIQNKADTLTLFFENFFFLREDFYSSEQQKNAGKVSDNRILCLPLHTHIRDIPDRGFQKPTFHI